MGSFFKMLGQTGSRHRLVDDIASDVYSGSGISLTKDQKQLVNSCILAIESGSNGGPVEDCERILIMRSSELGQQLGISSSAFRVIVGRLRNLCFQGSSQKRNYWWARQIVDDISQI